MAGAMGTKNASTRRQKRRVRIELIEIIKIPRVESRKTRRSLTRLILSMNFGVLKVGSAKRLRRSRTTSKVSTLNSLASWRKTILNSSNSSRIGLRSTGMSSGRRIWARDGTPWTWKWDGIWMTSRPSLRSFSRMKRQLEWSTPWRTMTHRSYKLSLIRLWICTIGLSIVARSNWQMISLRTKKPWWNSFSKSLSQQRNEANNWQRSFRRSVPKRSKDSSNSQKRRL